MDSRREEDHNKEYQVEEDSGEMDGKDVRGEDGCNQTDSDKTYGYEDRTAP